ncbi:MAG TPA: hypothetical protein VII22_21720, partial [Streptosporangiaceae bacterium]
MAQVSAPRPGKPVPLSPAESRRILSGPLGGLVLEAVRLLAARSALPVTGGPGPADGMPPVAAAASRSARPSSPSSGSPSSGAPS